MNRKEALRELISSKKGVTALRDALLERLKPLLEKEKFRPKPPTECFDCVR